MEKCDKLKLQKVLQEIQKNRKKKALSGKEEEANETG